jgi:hypothetical protein
LLGQGSIDARSSRPPVKEDDVDRERRCESIEKQKSAKDLQKKKEKKKNLERQALKKHHAKSRQKGSTRRTLLTRTMGTRAMTIVMTPTGWQLASIESLKTRHVPTSISRGRGLPRSHQAVPATSNKRRRRRAALVPRLLLRPCGAEPHPNRKPL